MILVPVSEATAELLAWADLVLLKRHGYHLIAAPESFLVTSRSALLGGECGLAAR